MNSLCSPFLAAMRHTCDLYFWSPPASVTLKPLLNIAVRAKVNLTPVHVHTVLLQGYVLFCSPGISIWIGNSFVLSVVLLWVPMYNGLGRDPFQFFWMGMFGSISQMVTVWLFSPLYSSVFPNHCMAHILTRTLWDSTGPKSSPSFLSLYSHSPSSVFLLFCYWFLP